MSTNRRTCLPLASSSTRTCLLICFRDHATASLHSSGLMTPFRTVLPVHARHLTRSFLGNRQGGGIQNFCTLPPYALLFGPNIVSYIIYSLY